MDNERHKIIKKLIVGNDCKQAPGKRAEWKEYANLSSGRTNIAGGRYIFTLRDKKILLKLGNTSRKSS